VVVGELARDPGALAQTADTLSSLLGTTARRARELRTGLPRLAAAIRNPTRALNNLDSASATCARSCARHRRAWRSWSRPRASCPARCARAARRWHGPRRSPDGAADLKRLSPLLGTAKPVLQTLAPVLSAANPILDNARVRLPDFFSFFSNWATSRPLRRGRPRRAGRAGVRAGAAERDRPERHEAGPHGGAVPEAARRARGRAVDGLREVVRRRRRAAGGRPIVIRFRGRAAMTVTPARLLAFLAGVAAVTALVVALVSPGGGGGYVLKAEFTNARGLVVGNDVRVNGAPAGSVKDIELTDRGTALVTLELHDGLPEARADASASIRPVGPARRHLPVAVARHGAEPLPGGRIAAARTTNAPRLDQLLNVFQPSQRLGLKALLVETGVALDSRGVDLNRAFAELRPALSATTT